MSKLLVLLRGRLDGTLGLPGEFMRGQRVDERRRRNPRLTEIERITNGKPSNFDMDAAFRRYLRRGSQGWSSVLGVLRSWGLRSTLTC
jgi:hypothetical protein